MVCDSPYGLDTVEDPPPRTSPTLVGSSAIREASFCDRVLQAAPFSIIVESWLIALGVGGLQTCTRRREENRTRYHSAMCIQTRIANDRMAKTGYQ